MSEKNEIRSEYSSRINEYTERVNTDKKIITLLSVSRLVVFVTGLVLSFLFLGKNNLIGFTILILSVVIFAILVKMYVARTRNRDYNLNMLQVNENGLNSLNEDYKGFEKGDKHIDSSHEFSHDLDLFGKSSLYQSLNRCCTGAGSDLLAEWINNPYALSKKITQRQKVVGELASSLDWRQRFWALGMMNTTSEKETHEFFSWMKEEPYFMKIRFIKYILIVVPAITVGLLFLSIFKVLPYSFFILAFLLNLFMIAVRLAKINRLHAKVSKRYSYLSVVSELIKHFEETDYESEHLNRLKQELGEDNISALSRVRKLAGLIHSFDSRINMIMGFVLNGMLLWDYQFATRIERWKTTVVHLVPRWFETIAEVDAFTSLADYAYNNPDYAIPEIVSDGTYLNCTGLGHHLINSSKRVVNDYIIEESGSINIITGANMAGKSTFLRTVGTNLILAMCGAPVCASSFKFVPVELYTSMRTSDSLSDDESYFFAELKRLRHLIEKLGKSQRVFFILDEILKGTNSKDKSEGSIAFIRKVIKLGGTGMVATHDISLGSLSESNPGKVVNSCFEIEIKGGEVEFDYLLRDGITTKMNAALLMKQQGII